MIKLIPTVLSQFEDIGGRRLHLKTPSGTDFVLLTLPIRKGKAGVFVVLCEYVFEDGWVKDIAAICDSYEKAMEAVDISQAHHDVDLICVYNYEVQ